MAFAAASRDPPATTLRSLLEDRRRTLTNDRIHDALRVQSSSLPLFTDDWHGEAEHREWQLITGQQQTPLIHSVHHGRAPIGVRQPQPPHWNLWMWPVPVLPLSQTLLLAPSLSLTLRSSLPMTDDFSDVPRYIADNFRYYARYDGSIVPNSDSTFSAWFGSAMQSTVAGFLCRVNPHSMGWPVTVPPLYVSCQSTSQPFADALHRTQINLSVHCRPFASSGDRGLLSMEVKRENSAEDNRWKSKVCYTHALSVMPEPEMVERKDFVPPIIEEASNAVTSSPHYQSLRDTVSDYSGRLWERVRRIKDEYFPDLYDSLPPSQAAPPLQRAPAGTNTRSSFLSSATQRTPPPAPWLDWAFPSYLTLAVSSPLNFLPYTHAPPPAYHINDSPLTHRARELSLSLGLMLLPFANGSVSLEHFVNYDAQSTFVTLNGRGSRHTMDSTQLYVNAGHVKHRGSNTSQVHLGLGLALGGI